MEFVELIKRHGDAHVVCHTVGKLCPAAIPMNLAGCDACVLVVDAIEYFVEDPHTEQEIIHQLERVCKWFPKYVTVCDEIVSQIFPHWVYTQSTFFPSQIEYGVMEFVELIKKFGDAKTVCKEIGLCK